MDLMRVLDQAGSDMIEIGIPFSDPIADGPVIRDAMNRSLASGFRITETFEMISDARVGGIVRPIVVMTYYNPVQRMGVERFCKRLEDAGADAILPVDLPLEESGELDSAASRHGLDVIRLIAPSTKASRIDLILSEARGFVYVVSAAGTTGVREDIPRSCAELLRKVTSRCTVPVVLGFGISRPEHVREALSAGAAGVVEGSKLISIYSQDLADRFNSLETVRKHVIDMKAAGTVSH